MSKQLAISSALSILLMAGFALFGAPGLQSQGAAAGSAPLTASAAVLR